MSCRHAEQGAVPPSTERARTLAARSGTGATLVATRDRITPTVHWLTPADLAAAEPDPFCHLERDWLRHLDQGRAELLHALGRHIPASLHEGRTRIRPVSVDRLGLRLRIENGEQTHDLRLAFHRPATTPAQLAIELHRLVGCRS